jgi:hypothetical protein
MPEGIKCGYCKHYVSGKVYKKEKEIKRKCNVKNKKVSFDSKSCKYFLQNKYFECEYGDRITIPVCMNRRVNLENLESVKKCKKCKCFEKEIRPIIELYYLERVRMRKKRTQKEEDNDPPKKRKLKRRAKPPDNKKQIKRRQKPQSKTKTKKIKRRKSPRKITRRSNVKKKT